MNRQFRTLAILSLVLIVGVGISSAQGRGGSGRGDNGRGNNAQSGFMLSLPAASADALPDDLVALVIAGWQDEQHAAAVYSAVIEQFGALRPFTNILRSEEQHAAAWETIMARYNIAIPSYVAPELEAFASFSAACQIGAEAEVANSALYASMHEAFAEYPDLLYVATALQTASENQHLPAFERCSAS